MQVQDACIIVLEDMVDAGNVIKDGHHFYRVMPNLQEDAECLLECFQWLSVRIAMKVHDACQKGNLLV